MLQCSHCGTFISEFRPKFFMVIEKIDPIPPNVKTIFCSSCGSLNYAINIHYCKTCNYFKPLYNPLKNEELLNLGCRGQCLAAW